MRARPVWKVSTALQEASEISQRPGSADRHGAQTHPVLSFPYCWDPVARCIFESAKPQRHPLYVTGHWGFAPTASGRRLGPPSAQGVTDCVSGPDGGDEPSSCSPWRRCSSAAPRRRSSAPRPRRIRPMSSSSSTSRRRSSTSRPDRNRFGAALERIADRVDATSSDLIAGDTTVSIVQFADEGDRLSQCDSTCRRKRRFASVTNHGSGTPCALLPAVLIIGQGRCLFHRYNSIRLE